MAADCKSAGGSLRWFKSIPAHKTRSSAGVAQLVEHQPSKLRVAGSSLVSRSDACIAQLVEHFHGKEGVISSSLIVGSCRISFF
jgi:hypothetical protein